MTMKMLSNILIIAGIIWILLTFMSFLQTNRMNYAMNILEKKGILVSGRNARFLKCRYITFAAVTNHGVILDAKLMRASFLIIPCRLGDFPQIKGLNVMDFTEDYVSHMHFKNERIDGYVRRAMVEMRQAYYDLCDVDAPNG